MTNRKYQRLLRAYSRWTTHYSAQSEVNTRNLSLGEWLANKRSELKGMMEALMRYEQEIGIAVSLRTVDPAEYRLVVGGGLPNR